MKGWAAFVLGLLLLVVIYGFQFSVVKRDLYSMLRLEPELHKKLVLNSAHDVHKHRRRGEREKIDLMDFFGVIAVGFLNDSKIIWTAFALSTIIGVLLPIVNKTAARFIGTGIVFIPVFLILSVIMFFGSADWKLYAAAIGILSSARLLTVIMAKIEDIEKDDYVMFLLLDNKTNMGITAKYTYPQAISSIMSAIYWTFTTIIMLVVSISFVGLSNYAKPSLGIYLRKFFNAVMSWDIFYKSSIVMGEVLLLIFSVYLITVGINKIILMRFGLDYKRLSRKKNEKSCDSLPEKGDGIHVEKLRVSAIDSGKVIIDQNTPISIEKGDKVFVSGPSGSGKTVFCSTLVGFLKESSLSYEGCVVLKFNDSFVDVLGDSRKNRFYFGIEYVPQNPRDSFDKYTAVEKQLKDLDIYDEVIHSLKENFKKEFWEGAIQSLKHPPSEINDGTLQVINFIVAIENLKKRGEGMVLFDEPIASLSKENVPIVLRLVKENIYKDQYIMLWIGHELEIIEKLGFDKVMMVEDLEEGIKFKLTNDVNSVLSKMRKSSEKIKGELMKLPGVKNGKLYDVDIKRIEFDKYRKLENYRKFEVYKGEVVVIKGDNGAGKSTLLKALIGYYRKFVRGSIIYYDENGNPVYIVKDNVPQSAGVLRKKVWKDMDVVFQNPDGALPKFALVKELVGKSEKSDNILGILGLGKHKDKRVFQLSYGQKKRLMLGRLLLREPKVVFLDEPTASLDYDNISLIVEKIVESKMADNSKTLFIITHDPMFDVLRESNSKLIELS